MKIFFYFPLSTLLIFFAMQTNAQDFISATRDNSGQTITLNNNQVLEIKLPFTPSNGYTWCLVNASDDKSMTNTIKEIGDRDFISNRTSSNGKILVGQSGTQIIRYVGTSQGTTELNLELRRSWEKNQPAIDNFSITVISKGKYAGAYTPAVKKNNIHVTSTSASIPSKWDWRPLCTPITNQGACGDCWAFAAVGTFECGIKIRDGVTKDISEAYLTNCDNDSGFDGCNGGWCPLNYWMAPRGAVYESDCPWTTSLANGTTGTCAGPYPFHETIDTFSVVANESLSDSIPPDSNMKKDIYNYGPIWVTIDASSGAFGSYTGGIFTGTGGITDHAVVLVGWVDSASVPGGGYWILRNSWGAGWGMSGYMYISYGSATIGCFANYIVYKGGVPHNLPPVANFGASSTTSCSGTIQFADSSLDFPTSWLWNFGDSTTSNQQNPIHTYSASGTYTVTLVSANSNGSDTVLRTNYIDVSLPASPTTTGASGNGPISVTLRASGSGTLYWYNAPTGGTLIDTGTTYITPILNTNTTYYVQSEIFQAPQSVGMAAKTSSGNYYTYTSNWAETFDALKAINIVSVVVYANSTANRTIFLMNSAGTILDTTVVNITSGQHTIPLNFHVLAGTGYQLGVDGGTSCNLWRDDVGASYPYTLPGLISITGNTAAASGYYYYLYNWQVQPEACISPRTPVTASIITGINEHANSYFDVFPNPNSGIFEIKLTNQNLQNATIRMMNILGETLIEKTINGNGNADLMQFDVSYLPAGMYYIKVQTEKETYTKKVCLK